MPAPCGFGFVITPRVDTDHYGDTITQRSMTGFLMYVKSAPMYLMSKKHTSCDSLSFRIEFFAVKQCCEYISGIRSKLFTVGIAVDGPVYIIGNKNPVPCNTMVPDSTLKKKAQSIAYHILCERSAIY